MKRFLAHTVVACALAGPAFALPVFTYVVITKDGTGAGTVASAGQTSCSPQQAQCTFAYVGSNMVELIATPGSGSVFVGWAGAGCYSTSGKVCYVQTGDLYPSQTKQVSVSFARDPAFPDFNGDGHPDIVWRHVPSGSTYLWRMNGPSLLSDAHMAPGDADWKIAGIGDFNADGKPDLVWRHSTYGDAFVWYMNGANKVSDDFLFSLPNQWFIEAIADFNKDGKPDFLLRNTATGAARVWFFAGKTPLGIQSLFSADPDWTVAGAGDFNGDGQPDLLFRHATAGLAVVWFTQYAGGTLSLVSASSTLFSIDPAWEIVQVADWNGDGSPDLLFRNRDTGVVILWYWTGTTAGGSAFVAQVDPEWEIAPRR